MDTINVRHGLTRINTVLIQFSVTSVLSVAKKLCGKNSNFGGEEK